MTPRCVLRLGCRNRREIAIECSWCRRTRGWTGNASAWAGVVVRGVAGRSSHGRGSQKDDFLKKLNLETLAWVYDNATMLSAYSRRIL